MKYIRYMSLTVLLIAFTAILGGCETNMVVFEPQGPVARDILGLINFSLVFMLVVVVAVFGLFGYIVWKYREKADNKDYEPPYEEGSHKLEIIWTLIPVVIVIALTIPTVMVTYDLEEVPKGYEDKEPITIHVTSADWKWIFSYPEEGIETVNYVNIPEDRPVHFKMTSAGTMQSFWVPELAGQKYTMANMETELYVVADNPGSYLGRNTNFNGKGYAHMEFEVLSQTEEDFDEWVKDVKKEAPKLTEKQYEEILKPGVVGRMTYNNTHLEWIDHAHHGSEQYIKPEDYRIKHGDHKEEGHEEQASSKDIKETGGDEHGSHGH